MILVLVDLENVEIADALIQNLLIEFRPQLQVFEDHALVYKLWQPPADLQSFLEGYKYLVVDGKDYVTTISKENRHA